MIADAPSPPASRSGTALALRATVLAAAWLIITAADPSALAVGAVAVALATLVSQCLSPPVAARWSLSGAARFVPAFLFASFVGGVDVARRAVHPRMPLAPGFIEFRLRLPPGTSRVLFTNVVNLLPGSLSADLRDDVVTIHAVDLKQPLHRDLRRIEHRVARLFGLLLPAEAPQSEGTR